MVHNTTLKNDGRFVEVTSIMILIEQIEFDTDNKASKIRDY